MAGEWLLVVNTIYNYLLLSFTQTITNVRVTKIKLWIMATLSSLIGILLFPSIIGVFISFFILLLAFPIQTLLFRQAFVLFIATLVVGGLLTAIQSYASSKYNMLVLWVAFAALILFFLVRHYRLQWIFRQNTFHTSCTLQFLGKSITLPAFIDTGNTCIEPISALPVHFVSLPAVKQQLATDFVHALTSWKQDQPYELDMFSKDVQKRLRVVPIQTVQGDTLALAFRLETLTIGEQTFYDHYIVFTAKDAKFPRQVDVILHVSMLPIT
ncbi:sigma-E processing peptidase SpoIIGA [Lysinibacillus sp. LZ02]|uniref:sigma-E processing peptidase SpoIIGA n=1 Tax=Lysinibacillus sp. LZ02 TaxID=3420668 RepID=UPI003D35EC06